MPETSRSHLVLIPSYNPGPGVVATVLGARAQWSPVWVVVDGSTDGTDKLLQNMAANDPGLKVLVLPCNQGKGSAVLAGTDPTGGVMRPMPALRIRITPKCTGSTPKAFATGRKIGVQMMISGVIYVEVEAENEKDAIDKAFESDQLTLDMSYWSVKFENLITVVESPADMGKTLAGVLN